MPYGLDDRGHPTFLISSMAMHTQNLQADPRSSLLVTKPDDYPFIRGTRRVLHVSVGMLTEGWDCNIVTHSLASGPLRTIEKRVLDQEGFSRG